MKRNEGKDLRVDVTSSTRRPSPSQFADAGRTFDLIEGIPTVIGRGEKSNTRLTDATVSRLHC